MRNDADNLQVGHKDQRCGNAAHGDAGFSELTRQWNGLRDGGARCQPAPKDGEEHATGQFSSRLSVGLERRRIVASGGSSQRCSYC